MDSYTINKNISSSSSSSNSFKGITLDTEKQSSRCLVENLKALYKGTKSLSYNIRKMCIEESLNKINSCEKEKIIVSFLEEEFEEVEVDLKEEFEEDWASYKSVFTQV